MARRPEWARVRCGRQVPHATFSLKHNFFFPMRCYLQACPFPFIPHYLGYMTAFGGSICRRPGGLGRDWASLTRPGCDCWDISFYPRSLLPACSAARKLELIGSHQAAHSTLRLGSFGASELGDSLKSVARGWGSNKGKSPHLNMKREGHMAQQES